MGPWAAVLWLKGALFAFRSGCSIGAALDDVLSAFFPRSCGLNSRLDPVPRPRSGLFSGCPVLHPGFYAVWWTVLDDTGPV